MLKGKKVIVIGDKDGIPGASIEACVKSAKAEVVFSITKCFACSVVGAMDIELQQKVKDIALEYGAQNLVVVIGGSEAETSGLCAETMANGDPTFVGPLSGIALGLTVYHVVEPEIKDECSETVYEKQCAVMEMVLEIDEIILEVKSVRDKYSIY
ncbi:glycine/sarcosine/betaine reductase complex selenoprotein A [Clostridium psychrophilum]|uniref:glycine/sarcosine/betaine reductase complex selenoprotein A n=1 Tax=Clostridium psychrophilum TaxID=132926 RepID=UPI001C0AA289|nr:glycine/sarcosine/betaine reductase complex selenoprotein A [Clostridium psychrophilum]MBU3179592.1 glycine/sarcosine/betaine reductase complex selenoprotein A [Clostridium psychrophilum]